MTVDSLIVYIKSNPIVISAAIGFMGLIGGIFVSSVVQLFFLKMNRRTEWNKKRKESYSKWIGTYFDYLTNNIEYVNAAMDLDHFNNKKLTLEYNDAPQREKIDRWAEEAATKNNELAKELREKTTRLLEYEAMIYIYESNRKLLRTFIAIKNIGFVRHEDKLVLLKHLQEYKFQQVEKVKEFAKSLNDKMP